jgi:predicted dehydrogenase
MTVSSEPADTAPLKLAVCGSGRWGQTLMRNITAAPDLELAAIISTRSSIPDEITHGAPVFGDWRTAVSRMNLDGILLALPPDRQPVIAEQIMQSGLPLFLEKPLALNDEAANRLVEAARNWGFVGLVDHLHLFAPEFQELVRQVRSRGAVRAITSVSGNRGPYRDSWSVCWDWAPHDVAMVLTIMESVPVSVSARIVDRTGEGEQVFENVRLTLTFANGAIADITTGNAFDGRRREFAVGVDDISLLYTETPGNEWSLVMGRGDDMQPVRVETVPPLAAALTEFAARVRQGEGGNSDLVLGAKVVRVLSAAESSIAAGVAVSVDPTSYSATSGAAG